MSLYIVSDDTLTSLANAIRKRTGENQELIFPSDFITKIMNLPQDVPFWEGDYTIVPKIYNQILETKNQIMQQNITIEAIPYFEVSNTSGGNTAHIGV